MPHNPVRSFLGKERRTILRLGLLLFTALASLAILSIPIALRPSSYTMQTGDVAQQDILAPGAITYQSAYLTEQTRLSALNQVGPVYLPVDPAITRRQIERLRTALDYVTLIRQDTYSSSAQKSEEIQRLAEFSNQPALVIKILALNEPRWSMIQKEALLVLEQAMRSPIRDNSIDQAVANLGSLISYAIPEDQAGIVAEIVSRFITPNSLFSPEQTQIIQAAAKDAVKPVARSYVAGEIIVRRGQVITPTVMEALAAFGLVTSESRVPKVIATSALILGITALVGIYFNRRKLQPIQDAKSLILIAVFFLVFLFAARTVIPNRAVIPYLFPIPAFALTIASLFNFEIGLILSLALSILSAFDLSNALDLTLYYAISSYFGVLLLGKGRRIMNFFWAGLTIGLAGGLVILAYRLNDTITDWFGIATLVGMSFLNGFGSASLTLLIQFLFAQLLGVVTPLQLMDLSRPDHPLLKYLLRNAPGTYQHCLQIANLAEQAAEMIGADSLMVRVGCLYHDIGKAKNPSFFVENQVPGNINSHDDIPPDESAAIIIRHVLDGIGLARKHRLPIRLIDFILEHHGTLLTRYQYTRALQKVFGNIALVDESLFRYPGPRPRSRETVLVMLADGCEARARAELPGSEDEMRELIRKVFEYLQKEGQFDDTVLTFKDLRCVQDSFLKTLQNTYHPRLQYPELAPAGTTASQNLPTQPRSQNQSAHEHSSKN